MALKDFRYEIYEGLRKCGRANKTEKSRKRVPQAAPVESSRYDNVGHFMDFTTQGRCRLCSKLTSVICKKCEVRLCFVTGKSPRNCQLKYHIQFLAVSSVFSISNKILIIIPACKSNKFDLCTFPSFIHRFSWTSSKVMA